MKKLYTKLAISGLAILMAVTMITAVSFAWVTLSTSPTATGIAVRIGGGNTILLAADVTEVVDGETVHYPGEFSSSLDLSSALSQVGGLLPVSTGDGIYWVIPTYDPDTGKLNDITQFTVDSTLSYANQSDPQGGNYICLDFWMVAPDSQYDVRVSCDQKTQEGSYLVELPKAVQQEDGTYKLVESDTCGAEAVRVGFLVNNSDIIQTGGAMLAYSRSSAYDTRFSSLIDVEEAPSYQFTIYEPNATTHSTGNLADGTYSITKPLRYDPITKKIYENSFGRVTVQESTTWRSTESGTLLQQYFQAYTAKAESGISPETLATSFYQISGQIANTVSVGRFFTSTEDLMAAGGEGTVVTQEALSNLKQSGATDDVVIVSLKRNVPQRVRMFIWLEGQDVDCTNDTSLAASDLALSIELAGATK
jgi:hypothetical protein